MNFPRRFATLLGLAMGLAVPAARGDTVVDFEELGYPNGSFDPGENFPPGPAPGGGSYDNGWDLKGGFTSNGVVFHNSYDTTYNSWAGWGYSNVTDATKTKTDPFPDTSDYLHQFAAVTGSGYGGSGNYGISFDDHTINGSITDGAPSSFIDLPKGLSPVSLEVTNSTYTYLSMLNGDGFGKKFTDGDYLKLQILGYTGVNGTGSIVGEVDFYLANYISADSLPVDVWTLVVLTPLAGSRSLGFGFDSSDSGPIGLNTPLYFAMDDLTLSPSAVPEPSSMVLALAGLGIAGLSGARRRRRGAAGR